MKNNRRDFLKISGLATLGLAGTKLTGCTGQTGTETKNAQSEQIKQSHVQKFNMSGYAAPKLDKVRIGNIGIGGRGAGALNRLKRIDGVEIKAICDLSSDRIDEGLKRLENLDYKPDTYSESQDDWK